MQIPVFDSALILSHVGINIGRYALNRISVTGLTISELI